jgi:hypothetical protein
MKQILLILCCFTFVIHSMQGQVDVYWSEDISRDLLGYDGSTTTMIYNAYGTNFSIRGMSVDERSNVLYWSELGTRIRKYDLGTSSFHPDDASMPTGSSIADLVMDYTNDRLFWTDRGTGSIYSADLDGSNQQTLVTGIGDPYGIDIDPTNNKIYYVDRGASSSIYNCNLDGTAQTLLLTESQLIDDVAIDPANNRIFWSGGNTTVIRTADLAGNGPTNFITGLPADGARGLEVDRDQAVLYYAVYNGNAIRTINTDGTGDALYVSTTAGVNNRPTWITIPNAPLPTPATALDFDGVDDQVVIPNDPAFSPTTGEITFECWAKSNTATWSGPDWAGLVSQRGPTPATDLRAILGRSGTTDVEFWIGGAFIGATVPDITQWHHYVGVYDGSEMQLYVDGVLAAQATTAIGILPLTDDVRIGYDAAGPSFPNRYLNGTIDEVRIWDYARCETEILAQKDCELAGTEAGLIAYYQFNEGVAAGTNTGVTTLPDISPNGHDGTLSSPPFALSGATSNWIDGTANGVGGACTPYSLPEVMVTEFLADPSGTDATDEWVEITNYGAVSYDLNSWTIEDQGVDNDPIATSATTIAAGASVIIARNKAQFENLWLGGCPNPNVLEVAGLTLANGPDEIIIKDNNGCRVHQVAFIGDERTGRATWYTEAFPPTTRVWGTEGSNQIDRQGNDGATGTLGYEENSTTADPNMRSALGSADIASPLENISGVASLDRGGAIRFNGANHLDAINPFAAQEFTVEMWINPEAIQNNLAIIVDNNHTGARNWVLQQNFANTNEYWFYTPSSPSIFFNLPANQWSHVVLVNENTTNGKKVYVNGVVVAEVTPTGPIPYNSTRIRFGDYVVGGRAWRGQIEEARIWDVVRTADEIRENMHLTLGACETGLVAYYQMNDGAGTTVTDIAGGNNGSFGGAPIWTASGVNVGNGGGSNSETISNVAAGVSTQTFAAANMTIEYLEHSAVEDVTVTYQEFTPNSTTGATGTAVYDNPMWTVNTSTSNTTQLMNLTFSFASAPFSGVTDGSKYRLFWRPMYDEGNWTQLDGQAIIVSATDVQFTGLYTKGQYMVVEASTAEVSDVRGNMYSFDGMNDHILMGNVLDFNNTDALTLEAWIKIPSVAPFMNFVGKQLNSGSYRGYHMYTQAGELKFSFVNTLSSNWLWVETTGANIDDNNWHHVAVIHDGSGTAAGVNLYVDGKLQTKVVNNDNLTATTITTAPFAIGSRNSSDGFLNGSIEEVRIWNVARTQNEIRENMHLTLKGDETGLVSYYQFNNDDPVGTAGGVKDAVGGNDGTTVGMTAVDYLASEVAVAGGVSDRLTVTGTGDITFPNTGVSINFASTPNGEIVVSRLRTEKPTGWGSVGGDVDNEYFVVWNYGTDQNPNVATMTFNGISHIPSTTANNEIALYKRGSRDFGATWGTAIANAASIVNHPVADVRFGSGALTTGFSQFVIVNNAQNADLPIELMAFNANRTSNDQVLLDWQTASELNNQGFYIERMLENETEFTAIGWIDGFGTTSDITHYEYNDNNAYTGVSYYRLRQVDFDGTETLSEVRAVNGSDLNVFSDVSIYPVPVRDELTVSFGKLPKGVNSGQVRIVDMQGRVIYEASVALASHQTLLIEEVQAWASGMYLLQIQLDNGSSMLEKFVKE